ncbi:hypothetical protein C8R47DRAFT_1325168 [Mycena vitilis]|nr:hypothetical protein C8R47DRAFT_1325168 [Mycena vitilis]
MIPPNLVAEAPRPAALIAAAIVGFTILRIFFKRRTPLDAIPSVGVPSYPFGFYVGALNYIKDGRAITQEGYLKHPGKAFKVALANRWLVILNGRTLIEDMRKAPDEYLSVSEAANSFVSVSPRSAQRDGVRQSQPGLHVGR